MWYLLGMTVYPKNGSYFIMQIPLPSSPALVPQGEGRKLPLLLGEGRGEGKKLAMHEVIAKALFPTTFFRFIVQTRNHLPAISW